MSNEANVWKPSTVTAISGNTKSITEAFTALEAQVLFNITKFSYALATGALELHKNGLLLEKGLDWVEVSETSFKLLAGATAGDKIIATAHVGIEGTVPTGSGGSTMLRFDFLADAAASDLQAVNAFATVGGLTLTDAKGATFVATTDSDISKAGTIEIGSGTMYDQAGKKFKLVGKEVWLETLGLAYTETPLDVASRIADLRNGGYIPKISESYNLNFPRFGSGVMSDDWITSLHRGLATHYPENTLLAFTMAHKSTPRGNKVYWETDVQISADGVPFLFHDKDVDNLTDGTGEARLKTIANLKTLKYTKCIGTIFETRCTIDTLEDFIKEAAAVGAHIEVEVKRYSGQLPQADYQKVTNLIQKYKMSNRTIYSSFYIEDLQLIRELDPYGALGLASNTGTLNTVSLDILRKLAAGSGTKSTILMSLAQWYAAPEQVTIAHAYDCDCMAYTADKGRELYQLAEIGIHKLHTNSNLR